MAGSGAAAGSRSSLGPVSPSRSSPALAYFTGWRRWGAVGRAENKNRYTSQNAESKTERADFGSETKKSKTSNYESK